MNIMRNFEAAFIVAIGTAIAAAGVAPYASMDSAAPAPATSIATPTQVAVVTVPAKRMSALEKQRSLEDERRVAKQNGAAARPI
ncbi:MAG: hypothetical protein JWQ01_4426 [Massilia sp.]|nr:hypothetical protein [Massilia sp.]